MLPRKGAAEKWDSSQALFLREIMEDFKDPSVNEITCQCSAQSAKTETLIALLLWALSEDPGPILWVTVNQEQARKIARQRIMPAIDMCAPVIDRVPDGRYDRTTTTIYFPGAPLVICGADSPANLQSTPYRYIFLDEVRSWRPGAPEMVSKRTRSFPHSYKKVTVSTPDRENDYMHRSFKKGSQSEWHCKCPECGTEFSLQWGDEKTPGGLKWDKNDETFVDGKWRYDRVLETIRYKCWGCEKEWRDNPRDRKELSNSGRWVKGREDHAKKVRSYTWNALLPWWPLWEDQVKEYLEAMDALRVGAWEPLKDHINETRGQVWTENYRFIEDRGRLEERTGAYDRWKMQQQAVMTPLEKNVRPLMRFNGDFVEHRRFFANDVQGAGGRHFFGTIRAWMQGGRSRLLHEGRFASYEHIREVAEEWGVTPDNVLFDAAHYSTEIYGQVLASGNRWKAFRGDKAEYFVVRNGEDRERRIVQTSLVDPGQGTSNQGQFGSIPLFLFSRPSTIDLLDAMISGLVPGWEIHEEASEEYRRQVVAYYRHTSHDKHGQEVQEWRSKGADHFADSERIQIAAAKFTGLMP